MANHQKLTPFKTPVNYSQIAYFWTILHSEIWTHFKTPENHTSHSVNGLISRPFGRGKEDRAHSITVLDSFQDPSLEIKEGRGHMAT